MTKPSSPHSEFELPIRLIVIKPPPGVEFCLQAKRNELLEQVRSTGEDITFDLTVRVVDSLPLNFLGPLTQGPPARRFLYVCSGTSAGQFGSCWTRRAKIPLTGITRELVAQVRANSGSRLEARVQGTGKDGGPACATVPLLDGGWHVVE
jgi:hypothetical protein